MPLRTVFAILCLLVGAVMFVIPAFDFEGTKVVLKKLALIPLGLAAVFFLLASVRVVDPGHVGIPITFGSVGGQLDAGVTFTNPFASIKEMSVRTEDYVMVATNGEGDKGGDDSIAVSGSDGATGTVDATVLYHLEKSQASTVFRKLGTGFEDLVVRPTARTCIRDGFVNFTMIEAATTKRSEVAAAITACMEKEIENRGLVLESFQLRGVKVSDSVQKAIDAKVAAEQAFQQAKFDLDRAALNADKVRVEAQGTADAQLIIACGSHTVKGEGGKEVVVPNGRENCENNLTPEQLQYLYIQTLRELVESPNNSTIILPFDQKLTPLLNMQPSKN